MKTNDGGRLTFARSKLAHRLVPTFVAVVVAPLIATVFIIGEVGQNQIVKTARTIQGISESAVRDAGTQFQALGSATVRSSGNETAAISLHASQAMSRHWETDQSESLATTGREFSQLTQTSFDHVMRQSLKTNNEILSDVSSRIGRLFAHSANYTQNRVSARVQTAILSQINTQMQERAGQLAKTVQDYVRTNQDYLTLTAQMINLYQDDRSGQKAVLDALVRRMPMLTEVSVLDRTGQETAMSASNHVVTNSDLANQSGEPYFKIAMQDQPFVAVQEFPADGRAPTLRLSVPIEIYRGNVVGVLAARLSLSDLWDVIQNTRFGRSGFAYVTTDALAPSPVSGRIGPDLITQSAPISPMDWRLVVAQPRQEVMQPIQSFKGDIASNTHSSLAQMHSFIAASATVADARLGDQAKIAHAMMIDQVQTSTKSMFEALSQKNASQTKAELAQMQQAIRSKAQLAQAQQDREMIGAAATASQTVAEKLPGLTANALVSAKKRLSIIALIIIIVACGLSGLIALLMTSAIVRPIVQLAEGTKAVADGDLGRRVDERAPAEIGDLAIAFNFMASSLQKSRTDLNEAEAQLVQSAKLASLGTLSAGVAHELNQPVAIVRGIAQQLRAEPGLSQLVKDDLALIEGQTSRMMKIIKHLRTFCRTGSGEQQSVDMNQVIRDCFILIDAQLKARAVRVELELCPGAPHVKGDANEFEQVFINLISNARDAMEGLSEAKVTITSRVKQDRFEVEFRDNGPGIPDEIERHIFDPFFTTKEAGKGTGLGLSISHSIIEKHQGSISVRNDEGAVFTISLPLDEAEANPGFDKPTQLAA